jgi:hypothetical protein
MAILNIRDSLAGKCYGFIFFVLLSCLMLLIDYNVTV